MPRSSKYYSVADMVELFKIKKDTCYAWNQQRKFTTYKIGGVLLFDKEEVDNTIESSKRRSMMDLIGRPKPISNQKLKRA